MMKRYLITEVVTMQAMPYREARSQYGQIGTLANKAGPDAPGFIVCHTHPLQFEWVPESSFLGMPFDSDMDVLKCYASILEQISEFVKKYSKSANDEQRNVIYNINRHLKAIRLNFQRLINQ